MKYREIMEEISKHPAYLRSDLLLSNARKREKEKTSSDTDASPAEIEAKDVRETVKWEDLRWWEK